MTPSTAPAGALRASEPGANPTPCRERVPGVNTREPGTWQREAQASAQRAHAQRFFAEQHYRSARQQRLRAMQAAWRVRSMLFNGRGPVLAMAQGPVHPSSALGDAVVDRAIAAYLALLSCEILADDETAETLRAAMAPLDDIARSARGASADEQRRFLDEMDEIDEMVAAIRQHLQDDRANG